MYINKQTTANAEFNPNYIKNLFNVKITFKTSSTIQYKILLTLKYAWHSQWGGVICSSFRDKLIIDIKYVNKQTNNMYINKQTTAKAGFNPNSIKNLINVKTTFKNIFHNLIKNITNLIICMT